MRKIFFVSFVLLLSYSSYSQYSTFMTYNIRYANTHDGVNDWENRKEFLSDQLKFYSPDIFGIQEGLHKQVTFLDNVLEKYDYTGIGRDDGKEKGEYSAIFYNRNKIKIVEGSTFWLSETPEKISVGWDAAMERICTYALFEIIESSQKFYVFNTHFDHIGKKARENSVDLILEKVQEINKKNYPVIVMGDLNLMPETSAIKKMSAHLDDSKIVAEEVSFGPSGTSNGFKFHEPVTRRIDYIFTDKEFISVKKYAVLSDSKNCLYPSDHLPVFIELAIK